MPRPNLEALRKITSAVLVFLPLLAHGQQQPDESDAVKVDAVTAHSETIVVTGTFEPVPLSESDRAVGVLETREEDILHGSLIEYLQLDPSIDVRQRGTCGIQADLSLRGSTFGQTLVLVNGLRLNDAQTGHHNMDIPVPLESVTRIEVLRGAGSTFHGADAMGGAVNFITAPAEASEIKLRTAVGNFGFNQQRIFASVVKKRWSQTLVLSRDFSSGFRPGRDFRSTSASLETRLRSGWGETSILIAGSDRPFGADQFYGNFNSWERTKGWFFSAGQELGKQTRAAFGYRRHSDWFVLFRDRPEIYANNHVSESWQAILRRRETLGDNSTVHYGVDAQADRIRSNNLGDHSRNRAAGYLNLDFRALRRASLSLGARQEFFSGGRAEFMPSIAGGVWLLPTLKLRASMSRAFRLPTYTDLYYQDPANRGNPALRPESAWSFEAGVEWDGGRWLSAEATVFHRRDKDVIDYIKSSSQEPWQATNIHNLRFTGVETGLRLRLPAQQQLDIGYTALYGQQDSLPDLQSKYVFNYPTHRAVFDWTGAWRDLLLFRTQASVVKRYGRDAYSLIDLAVSRRRGKVRPFLQLANIADTDYEEIPGVVMPGRGVVVGVELLFEGSK